MNLNNSLQPPKKNHVGQAAGDNITLRRKDAIYTKAN